MSRRSLVRDWIRGSLYAHGRGYFSVQDCVYSPPAPVRFRELGGKGAYIGKLRDLYAARAEAFLTPVEIFRPWYSRAIGRYLVDEIEKEGWGDGRCVSVVEVGGGNGTNAHHILDFVKEVAPAVYRKLQYTLVEISPEMAERQRQRVAAHGDRVKVVNQDFCMLDGEREQREGFVVALEVFDNLPHDKLVRKRGGKDAEGMVPWWVFDAEAAGEWFQTVVVEDEETGLLREELEPLSDPIAIRAAQQYLRWTEPGSMKTNEQPTEGGGLSKRIEEWARKSIAKSRKSLEDEGDADRGVFVPSGLIKFVDVLHEKFPHHRLVAADFDSLPAPEISLWNYWKKKNDAGSLVGCRNAPLVASKNEKGQTEDHLSYLSPTPGTADIFFQTDFEALEENYLEVTNRKATSMRSKTFLERYSDYTYTETRSGYNPMLEDYHNTKFILS